MVPSIHEWKLAYPGVPIWDNHGCMPLYLDDLSFMPKLEEYHRNGVDMVLLNVGFGETPWHDHFKFLAVFKNWISQRSDQYQIVATIADIVSAKAAGKLAIAFDIEGAGAVDDRPELIQTFYQLGVRWMCLAYNKANKLGGGCIGEDDGLTEFGRKCLDTMADVGMVACCTHTGWKTAAEAIEYNKNPTIFSHSNCHAVFQHHRNIPDDLIKLCASKGGVVGLNGLNIFLGGDGDFVQFFKHVDHIVNLVGPEHVGIGLDFVFDRNELDFYFKNMKATFPDDAGYSAADRVDFVGPSHMNDIFKEMVGAGYEDDMIKKIMGGNFLRIAGQVWK